MMQLTDNYTYFRNDYIHFHFPTEMITYISIFQPDYNWDKWVFDLDSTNTR